MIDVENVDETIRLGRNASLRGEKNQGRSDKKYKNGKDANMSKSRNGQNKHR